MFFSFYNFCMMYWKRSFYLPQLIFKIFKWTGCDSMVPSSWGSDGGLLRNTSWHLVLRLHLRRAVHAKAALPRPVRDGPAKQDLRHHRNPKRGRVAEERRRPQVQLPDFEDFKSKFWRPHSGNWSPSKRPARGKPFCFCNFLWNCFNIQIFFKDHEKPKWKTANTNFSFFKQIERPLWHSIQKSYHSFVL